MKVILEGHLIEENGNRAEKRGPSDHWLHSS